MTMAQDYSLFHILKDYSIDLWQKQISMIREKHGLIQMIVHPDYIIGEAERRVYVNLLACLADIRDRGETWIALPAEVAAWWRLRSKLRLTNEEGQWRIEVKVENSHESPTPRRSMESSNTRFILAIEARSRSEFLGQTYLRSKLDSTRLSRHDLRPQNH